MKFVTLLLLLLTTNDGSLVQGFVSIETSPSTTESSRINRIHHGSQHYHTNLFSEKDSYGVVDEASSVSRRSVVIQSMAATFYTVSTLMIPSKEAFAAAEREPLDSLLYKILRVREATQQESRLITTGKFKNIQRANVKLAIKFMIENYRLNDAFISASTYIDASTSTRLEAGQVGQRAVQNLYTILEYFDSADVQNLKIGQSSLTGKEGIVLKGLDAARQNIDDFLNYFPKSTIDAVIARVEQENELNLKEFDSDLGTLLNMPVTKYK